MDIYGFIIIGMVVGYLIGSIPFGLLIGKVFFHVDVREHGSGNLGSTNVTRTLGLIPGMIVLVLDILKGGLPAFFMYKIANHCLSLSEDPQILEQLKYVSIVYHVTACMSCSGHCHPLFANFKGGKAVASICGYLAFFNIRLFFVGIGVYLVVFLITRIVSLGSISAAIAVMVCQCFKVFQVSSLFVNNELSYKLSLFIFFLANFFLGFLLIYRHLANIQRLLHHEEYKFHFDKAKKK